MKQLFFIITLLTVGINLAYAESTLQFATTQTEFEQALTPKPTSKRQRNSLGNPKGIRAIQEDNPKVRALILFDFDSSTIKAESYSILREFANALQNGLSDAKIVIVGHTDDIGSETYNLGLSKRRAQSVKDFLISVYNLEATRLTINFYGEKQPIESNETELGRIKNRRVEFIRIGN